MDFSDLELLLFVEDALEPHRRQDVDFALDDSIVLERRLERLRAELEAALPPELAPFRIPPPGASWELSQQRRVAGEAQHLLLQLPQEAQDKQLVLLVRDPGWRLLDPQGAPRKVASLHRDFRGTWLELPALPQRRLAVVLVPGDFAPRWEAAEPWAELWKGLREGRWSVSSLITEI